MSFDVGGTAAISVFFANVTSENMKGALSRERERRQEEEEEKRASTRERERERERER